METLSIPVSLKMRRFSSRHSLFTHGEGPVQNIVVGVSPDCERVTGDIDPSNRVAVVLLGRKAYECLWMQIWCSPGGRLVLNYEDSRVLGLHYRPKGK
jgi:hypothetical protein